MTPRLRFAPSPTGLLHIGNARTALVNWLFARKHKGEFWLRLDDTDTLRSEASYAEAIHTDMAWLGLTHDNFFRQSDRITAYDVVRDRLIQAGRLYPCFETSEELEFKRRRQLARGAPPIYDRAALQLTEAEKQAFRDEGRQPHWRFLLNDAEIRWDDLVRGSVHYQASHLGDPVLIRGDGSYLYTFSSVVDDLEHHITHVIRGEDHVTNTAIQLQLYEAMGGKASDLSFAHLSLLVDATGASLSKRLGSLSLQLLREEGLEPMAINSFLAGLGTSHAIEPKATLEELAAEFDIAHFSRTPPRFDVEELRHLNRKLLHHLPFEVVRGHLKELGATHIDEPLWNVIRGNIDVLKEALPWQEICFGETTPAPTDAAYIKQALEALPPAPWSAETWKQWTETLKAATERKGKDLYQPLRLAITGLPHGPEMKDLMLLIGFERVQARLQASSVAQT